MIPKAVQTWLAAQQAGEVIARRPIGGGCINDGQSLNTSSGRRFFLKTNADCPLDMFACEAAGLDALRVAGGPRVPEVYLIGPDFLLMEDLAPAARSTDYWSTFGRQLAAVHAHTNLRFGFTQNNYIGSTPQLNPWTEDGYRFFAEVRLLYQVRLAARRGLLTTTDLRVVERLAQRLPELIPPQPACLLHGDLWTGNATSDAAGRPALIDPATHYGWAEAELAMTTLFGAFPDSFYAAYQEISPLVAGFQARYSIYNLYHTLNHLNLFGPSYLGQVQSTLRRFR